MSRPKNKELPVSSAQKIKELDIRYCIDIDYDNGTHRCNCGDDYCRCSTIVNVRINKVDINGVSEKIYDILKNNGVSLYPIESIIGQAVNDSLDWIYVKV